MRTFTYVCKSYIYANFTHVQVYIWSDLMLRTVHTTKLNAQTCIFTRQQIYIDAKIRTYVDFAHVNATLIAELMKTFG